MPYLEEDARFGGTYNVYIAGLLPKSSFRGRFIINLLASKLLPRTIPFHMSIRPEQAMIVRNCMTADQWSKEEELYLEGPFPFAIGSPFDLMLCHKPEGVSVAVNGQMAFEFKHRMDPNLIDALEITGAQMITSIQYEFL